MMFKVLESYLFWKRRLSAFFCTQNFWSGTFLWKIMAKIVLKNDQNQVFWGDTHSKLGHKRPKIRKLGNLRYLGPILIKLMGTFIHEWGSMSKFSYKFPDLGSIIECAARRARGGKPHSIGRLMPNQVNLYSVVGTHGTLWRPQGVLVPMFKDFCEISIK